MTSAPRFLSIDDVLKLHAIAVDDQGGDATLRDRKLLESAVAMPTQQFEREYLHKDIPSMASAYAFHICMNHPFVDGNKRAALAAMVAFLSDNGWKFEATADDAEPVILELAAGSVDKQEFTKWATKYIHEKPHMELRDFFSQIDPHLFSERFRSLLPAETGARPEEFVQRATESALAIPLINDLARQQREAKESGDISGWERVTMLAVGLMALYTIAEDLGYEW